MPFIDSYQTTAGSSVDTRRIVASIGEALAMDDLDKKPESRLYVQSYGEYHPLFITGTYPSEAKIPPFAHPISILGANGKKFICTDLRLFLKKDISSDFEKRISNRIDFEYAISRAILNLIWAGGRTTEFTSGFRFSAKVFSDWVNQILTGGLGLEAQDLIQAQIVSLAYYYSLCQNDHFSLAEERQRVTDWIVDLTGYAETGVRKVMVLLKPMKEFDHFIENLKIILDNIRVNKIDAGNFITLARSSWYGLNAPQILGVCIEHPPTWTAIIHHTLSSKGYQRCLIGQVALRSGKRGEADSFMRHYSELISQHMHMESATPATIEQVHNAEIDNHFDYDPKEMVMRFEKACPAM